MSLSRKGLSEKQLKLRDRVFRQYKKELGMPSSGEVPKGKERFVRADKEKTARMFDYVKRKKVPAKAKGRIVYAYKTYVTVRGKQMVRHRDSRGMFVSVRR